MDYFSVIGKLRCAKVMSPPEGEVGLKPKPFEWVIHSTA